MERIKFDFKDSLITEKKLTSESKKAVEELKKLSKALKLDYDEKHTSINLCSDNSIIKNSEKIFQKVKDAKTIVVIGIGGSNLGTLSVYEAIKGKLHNEIEDKKVRLIKIRNIAENLVYQEDVLSLKATNDCIFIKGLKEH